jgi:transposase
MLTDLSGMRVFLKLGVTDMRKSINTLSILVQAEMKMDPFAESLYVFSNRGRNIVKILYWQRNGFCLWMKRLEKERFRWPGTEKEVMEVERHELEWLLNGLDITKAHEKLNFSSVI